MKTSTFVEYEGKQFEEKEIVAKIKEFWVSEGHKIKDILELKIYIKPEESTAYFIINDSYNGKIMM